VKPLTPDEIRREVHGVWLTRHAPVHVKEVTTDGRTAKAGSLFVALKGRRFDGHDYLHQAAEAGCIAAIVRRGTMISQELAERFEGGVIAVPDTTEALGELAAYYRSQVPARVVAVTGSNGKTTTKRMIHHILSRRLRGSCSPRSFNNAVGVPLTLLAVAPADDYVVCELGSNAPGEIASLARIAAPDLAVITSIGPTHLEGLGSVENVAVEKASILSKLRSGGVAVVTADSEALNRALRAYDCRLIRFGLSRDAELRLTGYEPDGPRQRFQINGRLWVALSVPGRHNAMNALAAIAVAQRFGMEREAAAEALADFNGTEMRLELIDCNGVQVLNDAYNSNPSSVLAAIEAAGGFPARRRVAILGDMRELGDQAESVHERLGADLALRKIDLLIGVGGLGRYIAKGAAGKGLPTETFDSTQSACEGVCKFLCRGDLVLVKGSRAMQMERLVQSIREGFARKSPRAKRAKK